MKQFITILIAFLTLSLVSCEKTLTIDFSGGQKDTVPSTFTNTVSFNGNQFNLSEIDITVEEYGDEESGLPGPVFVVEGEANELIGTLKLENGKVSSYNSVIFRIVIPADNYSKTYNLKDKNTYGMIAFANGLYAETSDSYGYSTTSNNFKATVYISNQNGDRSEWLTDDSNYTISAPKNARYYIDIEHAYKDFYRLYIEYEDANGDKYTLSYRGEK